MKMVKRDESGLSSKEIRLITHFDRNQVFRMLRELRDENPNVRTSGYSAGARYFWQETN